MAPEVLDPESNGYGQEADFWAIGVIMFEMYARSMLASIAMGLTVPRLAGFPTFYSSTESGESSTFEKILNWRDSLQVWIGPTHRQVCVQAA